MDVLWAASDFGQAAAAIGDDLRRRVVEIGSGRGFGAGTIWHPAGIIVTNHHVVPDDRPRVRLADGTLNEGRVLGRDLKIVLAVGHPYGLSGAMSLGILTSTEATEGTWGRALIRADVAIAPGNSGGPLADASGRVVGINVMIGGGMALAVPLRYVTQLAQAVFGRQAA
jgi:serine protease Do